jgi:DNA-binding Lrp family transcriptional regulator
MIGVTGTDPGLWSARNAATPPDCRADAAMPHRLDTIDLRIVRELLGDGRMTNVALASRVGITPPPCLRRVRSLEDAGIITGYAAEVDEAQLGFELTAFAMVGLHAQTERELRAFENRVLTWPIVREAYMMSGDSDYVLRCVAANLTAFQQFITRELTAAPNVATVKTSLAIRRAKREAGVPIVIA